MVSGILTVNGRLHVRGNLDVSGLVKLGPVGDLIVDGHKKIGGETVGVIDL